MAIDINNISPTPPGKSQNNGTGNAVPANKPNDSGNTQAAAVSQTASQNDSVELSNTAQELTALQRALQELPEVDEARVEQIRQQLADGSYSLDNSETAARILADDQNFLL